MLGTIPVLLSRLFAAWNAQKDQEICLGGPFDPCFGLPTGNFWSVRAFQAAKSLDNKTGIVPSVAKSDEIGKNAHLV